MRNKLILIVLIVPFLYNICYASNKIFNSYNLNTYKNFEFQLINSYTCIIGGPCSPQTIRDLLDDYYSKCNKKDFSKIIQRYIIYQNSIIKDYEEELKSANQSDITDMIKNLENGFFKVNKDGEISINHKMYIKLYKNKLLKSTISYLSDI